MLSGSLVHAVLFTDDGSNISMLDSNTGAVLNSFSTPSVPDTRFTGLAFSGSSLFRVNGIDAPLIAEFDAITGALLNTIPTPFDDPFVAEGFQLGYGVTSFGSTLFIGNSSTVFLLDPSDGSVFTQWNPVLAPLGGMSFNPATGTLFIIDGTVDDPNAPPPDLLEYDPITGGFLGSVDIDPLVWPDLASLAFDQGSLFAASFNFGLIYEIDPSTGDLLNQFSGLTAIGGMAGGTLVPIPPALWLFGSGLLGLIGIARRKKAA